MQVNAEQIVKKSTDFMQSTVKERLIEYLKSQGVSQRTFEQTIGVSNGYVNNIRVSIQPDKVLRIAQHYPNLNTGWLLSGEGHMLKGVISGDANEITYREVFDKLSKLIDTVTSQQQTISDQTRMIDRLISGSRIAVRLEGGVDSADAK